jgi:hypothetical protein
VQLIRRRHNRSTGPPCTCMEPFADHQTSSPSHSSTHKPASPQYRDNNLINFFFCSTLSEFENFLLCERILINVTTCQNET